jgi:curved DNA-binding protein CbpA
MKTHYETLSVGEDATEDDIKAAYKRRAHECHPDRHGGNLAAEEAFKNLGAAYGVLRDSSKRASYDLELKLRRAEAAEARRPTPAPSWSPPRPAPAPVPRWAPPPSGAPGYAAPPAQGSGFGFGTFLCFMFLGGAAGAAMAAAEHDGDRWDPVAGRYRDRFGRFSRR